MQAVLLQMDCPTCYTGNRMVVSASNRTPPVCGKCGAALFRHFAVLFGYVYLLSNPAMKGLLKIGHTTGSLRSRVEELSAAPGVRGRFVVEAYFLSQDPRADENSIHAAFGASRRQGREFYSLKLQDALAHCEKILDRNAHYVRARHGPLREL